MKNYLYLIFVSLLSASFASCSDCEIDVKDEYRSLMFVYEVGDTVNFLSETGVRHSFIVVSIDSITLCLERRKELHLNIRYLEDINKSIKYHNSDGDIARLLTIGTDRSSDRFIISYRGFGGYLEDKFFHEERTYTAASHKAFSEIVTGEHWKIPNFSNSTRFSDTDIVEVVWTKEYGLTQYTLQNGDVFRIEL